MAAAESSDIGMREKWMVAGRQVSSAAATLTVAAFCDFNAEKCCLTVNCNKLSHVLASTHLRKLYEIPTDIPKPAHAGSDCRCRYAQRLPEHHYRMNDCKSGDWQMIGRKDGEAGLTAQFDDRRDFCAKVDSSKVTAESGTLYLGGWTSGNQQFWYRLGRDDGNRALPVSQFAQQLKSEKVVENKTPPQERFYVDGWTLGNGEYWFRTGDADGRAGSPVKLEQQRQQEGAAIGFRSDQYRSGWAQGNQGYWFQLGVADAHDGIPDSRFKEHEQNAKQREVFVRADAYQQGWDKEIIEYWRRLAWEDAVNGRDVNNRRADAQARGLKFSEHNIRTAGRHVWCSTGRMPAQGWLGSSVYAGAAHGECAARPRIRNCANPRRLHGSLEP
jgi:predicted lipoprotein with Yx(FWY)xxD motif